MGFDSLVIFGNEFFRFPSFGGVRGGFILTSEMSSSGSPLLEGLGEALF